MGREALALLDEHADKFATVVADADIIRAGQGQARATSRSRTCASTSRTGTSATVSDDEEDDHVRAAAHALAESQQAETAPPFTGIRIKSFEKPTRAAGCAR